MSKIAIFFRFDFLLNSSLSLKILLCSMMVLLFGSLGGREIWTLETRWANIVLQMLSSGDYFHPMLMGKAYYDKPLLSYWLIALSSWFTGELTLFSLRFSSAASTFLAIFCTYLLGKKYWHHSVGLLAGWMLTTTYFFVFWGRVASADMLNVAGTLLAVWWFVEHKNETSIKNYVVFFVILAVTSLCKGLLGFVLPCLIIFPFLLEKKAWQAHLNGRIVIGLLPGFILYLLPFFLSASTDTQQYADNGLFLVFRENIVRFFNPWDHVGPLYLYFLYLPIYLLPWTFFLFPAIKSAIIECNQDKGKQFFLLALTLVFVFFTASGSRRSYYVLPMIPLAILLIAAWLSATPFRLKCAKRMIFIFYFILFLVYVIFMPLYYRTGGPKEFNLALENALVSFPQKKWRYVLLEANNKIPIYLRQDRELVYETFSGQSLSVKNSNTIFISTMKNRNRLRSLLLGYQEIIFKDETVAFIPKNE